MIATTNTKKRSKPRATASPAGRPSRRIVSFERREYAAAVLFKAGFAIREVAAILQWAEHVVHSVIRKYLP